MSLFRSTLVFLALVTVGTLATAQKTAKSVPVRTLTAAGSNKLVGIPSIEQVILRAAAAKLRQEGKPTDMIELQLTAKIRGAPNGCYQICVGIGFNSACSFACDETQ